MGLGRSRMSSSDEEASTPPHRYNLRSSRADEDTEEAEPRAGGREDDGDESDLSSIVAYLIRR